jgi:type IV secretion system protein VirB8
VQGVAKDKIESGDYFVEARNWYNSIFLSPIKINAFVYGASISIIMVLFFISYSLYNIFPLSEEVRIVVHLESTRDFIPVLKSLKDPGKSTKQSVLEYLSTKYVKSREIYNPKTFKKNYYFILRSTEKNLFNKYYDNISKKNDQNPSLLYKKGDRSKFFMISNTYDGDNNFITVNFSKQNYNVNTGKESWQKLQARLKFDVSDYNFAKSENARLSFIVTDYEIREINA